MTDFVGNIITRENIVMRRRIINSILVTTCADINVIDFTDNNNFTDTLQVNMHVSLFCIKFKNQR